MRFTSKFLNKKAWENEQFSYFGMVFDVHKAEQIVAAHPRPPQVAPKAFLEAFVGRVGDDEETINEDGSRSFKIDMLQVGLNKEHLKTVDITKPGIVAEVTHAANKKRGQGELKTYILIDGNHRAKRAMQEGQEFKVYILTAEESWEVMSKYTPPFLLKNYVNPTKGKRKSKG